MNGFNLYDVICIKGQRRDKGTIEQFDGDYCLVRFGKKDVERIHAQAIEPIERMNSKAIIAIGGRVRLRHENLGGNASSGTVLDIFDGLASVRFDRGGVVVDGIPVGSLTLYNRPLAPTLPPRNYSGVV